MNWAFGYEDAISLIMTRRCHVGKEFVQEFGITGCAFNSEDIHLDLCWFTAVAEVHPINLKLWEDGDKVITIRHRIELCWFQMRCKVNDRVGLDFDKHKLVCQVVAKVCKVSQICSNFGEITDCYWPLSAQSIQFDKNSFVLEPCEQVFLLLRNLIFSRLRLLITWQPMQTCDVLACLLWAVATLKYFLNLVSPVGSESNARMICLSLVGICRTKDGLSLIIMRKSQVIAWIGLNFVLAIGGGKYARIVRSKSRVTKFFVTWGAGVSEVEVRACELVRERSAAAVTAMVEWGGSVIDPRKIV